MAVDVKVAAADLGIPLSTMYTADLSAAYRILQLTSLNTQLLISARQAHLIMPVHVQVAAADLGIPLSSVYIAETATDKVPNSSPTAASASSDMYGSATADACAQLNARLKPYREKRPDSDFTQLVNAAYLDRVDLSAHGFYATPDITGQSSHSGCCPFYSQSDWFMRLASC